MTTTLRERAEHAAKYSSTLMVPARDIKQLLEQVNQAEARIQAAKDICAKPLAVKVQGSTEADAAAAAVAAVVLRALAGEPQ